MDGVDSSEAGQIARQHAEKMGFKEVKVIVVENKLFAGQFYFQVIVRADGGLYQLRVYESGTTLGWKPIE